MYYRDMRSFCVSLLLALPVWTQAADLVVLVDTGTEMPMARFADYQLVDGIHRDIGLELARRTGRTATFMSLPRKRISRALEDGEADVLCSCKPEWLDGSHDWTQPFIPIVQVLITDRSVPAPRHISELAGKQIGTVLGYVHPEIEAILGKDFVRSDGPTTESNLRKVGAGRVKYAVTGKSFLEYRLKTRDPLLNVHPPLVVSTYMGQCAVSKKAG